MKKSILFIFLLMAGILEAQNIYDITQFKEESINFIKQPSKWDGNDWLKLGIIGAGTLAVMQTDQSIREIMLRDRSYYKSFPIEFGRIYGELYSPLVFTGAFGIHSLITDDNSSRKIAFEIAQTTFYASAVTTLLKVMLGRSRPYTGEGSGKFLNLEPLSYDLTSFPSGHTTIAFSISTVLAKNSKSDFVKILCYIPAVMTAFSRMYQDQHWASDVLLGGIIGYAVGSFVTSTHEKNDGIIQVSTPQSFSILIPLN